MKLATIETITEILEIENADNILIARVQGWQSIVKKQDNYKVGDKVIFIVIDTILPKAPWSEFLADKNRPDAPIRLRTAKLRGTVSQGLILPQSILDDYPTVDGTYHVIEDGLDYSEVLGIEKYSKPIHASLAGNAKGNFPSFIRKTDSENVLSNPKTLEEFRGKYCVYSYKYDGSSGTFYFKDGEFGVCSRNLELQEDSNNGFWQVAQKYDLSNKLIKLGKNIALQGELVSPKINGGHTGTMELDLFIFDIFDIDNHRYYDFSEFTSTCQILGVKTVIILETDFEPFNVEHVDQLVAMTKNLYYDKAKKYIIEGLILRPAINRFSEVLRDRLQVKIINPEFLLKYKE